MRRPITWARADSTVSAMTSELVFCSPPVKPRRWRHASASMAHRVTRKKPAASGPFSQVCLPVAGAAGALDCPGPLRPGRGPGQEPLGLRNAGADPQLTQRLLRRADRHRRVRGLVRIDPDHHCRHRKRSFPLRRARTVAGTPNSRTFAELTPLLSHATARPRPAGTSFESQTQQGAAGGSRAKPTGQLRLQTRRPRRTGRSPACPRLCSLLLPGRTVSVLLATGRDPQHRAELRELPCRKQNPGACTCLRCKRSEAIFHGRNMLLTCGNVELRGFEPLTSCIHINLYRLAM
jgi:hypothetical protein